MICKKSHSFFDSQAGNPEDMCYYHWVKNKNFEYDTLRVMLRGKYSCDMIRNFLIKKYVEIGGNPNDLS
jgi:hypothetical protein